MSVIFHVFKIVPVPSSVAVKIYFSAFATLFHVNLGFSVPNSVQFVPTKLSLVFVIDVEYLIVVNVFLPNATTLPSAS